MESKNHIILSSTNVTAIYTPAEGRRISTVNISAQGSFVFPFAPETALVLCTLVQNSNSFAGCNLGEQEQSQPHDPVAFLVKSLQIIEVYFTIINVPKNQFQVRFKDCQFKF